MKVSLKKRKPPKLSKEDTERFLKRAKENEEKLQERVKKLMEEQRNNNE